MSQRLSEDVEEGEGGGAMGGGHEALFSTEKLVMVGVCVTLSLRAGCERPIREGTLGLQAWPDDSKTRKSLPMPRAKLATLGDSQSRKAKRETCSGSPIHNTARFQRCASSVCSLLPWWLPRPLYPSREPR